ncbi:protein CicA [Waddlia chondrophila 2032/99]|uniref:Protein CicA n=2 Tax=Waddlia chondrophila TaxID=71667 RepID=F8LEK1_9BACT|nr:HAD-IB family hydrolase [Waddlia chondrophila]ADI39174.1 putative hydrolase [Waddlia chondrophila WSU 86-1044]CCB91919.1 protein CicA [Waddlia chondrophila 2032/99]
MESKQKLKKGVAAFDFDGTLTYRDSFFQFLIYTFGWWDFIRKTLPILPKLVWYLLGKVSRTEAKESLLTQFFKGRPMDEVRKMGESFVKSQFVKFRPEALARLRWHQRQGHRCFIVSASVDVWLEPWAKENGIERVLSSRLEVDHKGCVTGKLAGKNCRREEKVHRLEEVLGPLENYEIYAYGDTIGDKEMMKAADHPYFCWFPKNP